MTIHAFAPSALARSDRRDGDGKTTGRQAPTVNERNSNKNAHDRMKQHEM